MRCLPFASSQLSIGVAVFVIAISGSILRAEPPQDASHLLSREQWKQLERSVDKALSYLATRQEGNGSFATLEIGQPGITSLCVLAYLSRGHVPREGEYGRLLDRAIQYVLRSQQSDGLLFGLPVQNREWGDKRHKTGAYNHAIAGVMLAEVYGMTQGEQSDEIGRAIVSAIKFSIAQQMRRKPFPDEKGGWRYLVATTNDADLSVTAWEVMFLRAARNAGFDVPVENIDMAMDYVRRMYVPERKTFAYGIQGMRGQQTRAMAGSGILLLSLGGEHHTEMAKATGEWIKRHEFMRYNKIVFETEHYHYGAYYCSQAMFQLGGKDWEQFFPKFMQVHLAGQQANGSWPPEPNRDGEYGETYTTSLMVLSLTPPFQLLPIYQR